MTLVRAIDILLVEDNPGDVLLTKTALKKAKMKNHLHVVSDGEQGLQYLRQEGEFAGVRRPDLILLDLNLPRLSGIELLTIVKKDEDLRKIPVIVLTTSTNEDDVLNSYHHHANAYVTKPVNVEELFDVIRAFELFWLAIVTLPPE